MQPSDEIKSRLDIVDIIRDYVPLKAAGVNFRANCPFHREKTPSFMVSPEKQIYHCFGCGKGGDVLSFIMEIEGVSFVEALRILAPKAGVTLQKQNPQVASKKNRLLDIMEASVNFYHDVLSDNPQAEPSRKYLKERGLSEETIKSWQIGYAPESWDDIMNWLKGKGFSENEIFLAGMSIKKEGTNRYYNRFRDRIMFPIWDVNGNSVAFSARVNPAKEEVEKMGKYINSPQTMIYDKSKILFGLDKAKMEIKSQNYAILVEGQMDVITAHQHGFKNVIASSGTALTTEQVALIKRYTNNIALAFDMDNAGQMAADRGIREAMRAEMNIKVIELDEGKDPDEFIKKDPSGWVRAVENSKPMMEYYFDKTFKDLNPEKIDDKREAAKKLLPIIIKLENSIEKDHWIKKLSQKIDIGESALREAIAKIKKPVERNYTQENKQPEPQKQAPLSREEKLSEVFIALLIKFPYLIQYSIEKIGIDQLFGLLSKSIYKELILYYNSTIKESSGQNVFQYGDFKNFLSENIENSVEISENGRNQIIKDLDRLALLGDRDFYDFDDAQAKKELVFIILTLKKIYLSQRMKEIEKIISESEENKDYDRVASLMEELKILSEEKRNIEE